MQWPFNESTPDYGTQRLFADKKFYTSSTKAIIHSVPDDLTSEKPTPDFPLY